MRTTIAMLSLALAACSGSAPTTMDASPGDLASAPVDATTHDLEQPARDMVNAIDLAPGADMRPSVDLDPVADLSPFVCKAAGAACTAASECCGTDPNAPGGVVTSISCDPSGNGKVCVTSWGTNGSCQPGQGQVCTDYGPALGGVVCGPCIF